MKNKYLFYTALTSVPLFSVLRILQHVFVIDANGLFVTDTPIKTVLSCSLYVLSGVLAILALISIFTASKDDKLNSKLVSTIPMTGILFIILAIVQLYGSGYLFGVMLKTLKLNAIAILRFGSAIFFLLYGISLLASRKYSVLLKILGFFPPIYSVALGIDTFFKSFEAAHVSKNVLETLTVCAMSVMLYCISASHSSVPITLRRFKAISMLFVAYASASALGETYTLITSTMPLETLLRNVEQIILIPSVLIMLCFAGKMPKTPETEEKSEEYREVMEDFDKAMNIYIQDIQEENKEE